MKLSIVFVLVASAACMRFDLKEKTEKKERNIALSIVENFFNKGASFKDIKKILGEPVRVYSHKGKPDKVYVYNNKVNNYKEWNFAVNEEGDVVWLNYMPWYNPVLDRVEILPQTWKKYRCKKKSKLNTSNPHITYEDTFFECADGKIRAYYNVHGEITIIAVDR